MWYLSQQLEQLPAEDLEQHAHPRRSTADLEDGPAVKQHLGTPGTCENDGFSRELHRKTHSKHQDIVWPHPDIFQTP